MDFWITILLRLYVQARDKCHLQVANEALQQRSTTVGQHRGGQRLACGLVLQTQPVASACKQE